MAITTAYSSVSLSCYPSNSSPNKPPFNIHNISPSPSKNNSIKLVPIAAALATLITSADEEVLPLTNSSASSAAVSLSGETERFLAFRQSDYDVEMDWRDGISVRRRRRRKRRKQESENLEDDRREISNLSSKPKKSGQYLTSKAEAEYSFCLKVLFPKEFITVGLVFG